VKYCTNTFPCASGGWLHKIGRRTSPGYELYNRDRNPYWLAGQSRASDAAQEEDEEKEEEEEEEEEEEGQATVQYIIPTSIVLSMSNFLFALLLLSPGDGLA